MVSYPVQQNLYNKDTFGTMVSYPILRNLCNEDTIVTNVNCPVSEGLNLHKVMHARDFRWGEAMLVVAAFQRRSSQRLHCGPQDMHTCTMWCYKLIADTVPQEG
jgi:hypothetical protein